MASSHITSWQIDEEKVEAVTYFTFLGFKITVDSDCSHEIKRCLLFRRKAMSNLDSILKCKDITLPTKVHLVKDMVFPVVMFRCESWKAEHQELMLSNCDAGEDSWKSLGLQGDQTVAGRGTPSRARNWANTQKWTVRGDTCADKARDFIGKECVGGEQ